MRLFNSFPRDSLLSSNNLHSIKLDIKTSKDMNDSPSRRAALRWSYCSDVRIIVGLLLGKLQFPPLFHGKGGCLCWHVSSILLNPIPKYFWSKMGGNADIRRNFHLEIFTDHSI